MLFLYFSMVSLLRLSIKKEYVFDRLRSVHPIEHNIVNRVKYDCGCECFGNAGYAKLIVWVNFTVVC